MNSAESFEETDDDGERAARRSGLHERIQRNRALAHMGNYRLLELIGSGAMGDVYRAEHVLLGRRVAVKVLHPHLVWNEDLAERFFAEARAVNLVGHPHIVEITDFAREPDGTVWFVMELLDGDDLAALLNKQPPSLRQALELARQLCDALGAVHEVGIVHRDVKPENVFITRRDGSAFVKLLDFGIARMPDAAAGERATVRGLVMGTPPYMAPEQARGQEIDFRTDLYAVGAVLFELITGRPLFERKDIRALLEDVAFAPPRQVSSCVQLPACVRDDVDNLLARCLAKDRTQRPQSAHALAQELAAIAAQLDAWAEPPATPATPLQDSAERETSAVLASCRPAWPLRVAQVTAASIAVAAGLWLLPRFGVNLPIGLARSMQGAVAAAIAPAPLHVVTPLAVPAPAAVPAAKPPAAEPQLVSARHLTPPELAAVDRPPTEASRTEAARAHMPAEPPLEHERAQRRLRTVVPPEAPELPPELSGAAAAEHGSRRADPPEPEGDLDIDRLLDPFSDE